MQKTEPERNPDIPADMDADALVELLDSLCVSGSQHINLDIGETTKVQTVNSTECSKPGACAIPNLTLDEEDEEAGREQEDGDEEF